MPSSSLLAPTQIVTLYNLGDWIDKGTIEPNKINPKLPIVTASTIEYVPTSTNNTNNKNAFVVDPNGTTWFIDYLGNATQFATSSGTISNTLDAASNAITSTVNGVTSTLTPISGTIAQQIGFNSSGDLVTQSPHQIQRITTSGSLTPDRLSNKYIITATGLSITLFAPSDTSTSFEFGVKNGTSVASTITGNIDGASGTTITLVGNNIFETSAGEHVNFVWDPIAQTYWSW